MQTLPPFPPFLADLGAGIPSAINNHGQAIGHFRAGVFPNNKGFPLLPRLSLG